MGGIVNANDTDAGTRCELNRLLHPEVAHSNAQTMIAVERSRSCSRFSKAHRWACIDRPVAEPRQVVWQPGNAMGIDTPQTCLHKSARDNRGVLERNVESPESVSSPDSQFRMFDEQFDGFFLLLFVKSQTVRQSIVEGVRLQKYRIARTGKVTEV